MIESVLDLQDAVQNALKRLGRRDLCLSEDRVRVQITSDEWLEEKLCTVEPPPPESTPPPIAAGSGTRSPKPSRMPGSLCSSMNDGLETPRYSPLPDDQR